MIFIDKDKCTACKICAYVCPHQVIEMNNGTAVLAYQERCIECGACQLNCSFEAISVTKGTACLRAIIKEDILKIKDKGCGCC
jgi:NAD-dependent dihydropyrimidine dehydrogenase PreA subunit